MKGFRKYKSRSCKYSRFQLTSNQTPGVVFFFWGGGHHVCEYVSVAVALSLKTNNSWLFSESLA